MTEQVLDFVKQDRDYYNAKEKPELIEIGRNRYLSIDGRGKPDQEPFQTAIGALYTELYSLKFFYKIQGKLFKVPKLENLWWVDEGEDITELPLEQWRWKLMLRIPDYVTLDQVRKIAGELHVKGKLSKTFDFQIESIEEGKCVHVMHIGPYENVDDAYKKVDKHMMGLGLSRNGPYHEIYISDPTKTEPEKLKTIIRVPVS